MIVARRHKRVRQSKDWLMHLASFGALAAVWEIAGQRANPLIFAPLSKIALAWVDIATSGELLGALWLSISALFVGLALSLVVGITLGVMMGWFRLLQHIGDVLFTIIMVVPMVGLIPILVIAFGLGLEVRVATVFLFTVPIVGLSSYSGTKGIDQSLVEMARSFGARDWQLVRRIVLPAAVPGIMSGVRLGIGRSVVGMVSAELLVVSVGIGLIIMRYSSVLATANLYAAILSVTAIGILVSHLGQWLDELVTHRQGRQAAFERAA